MDKQKRREADKQQQDTGTRRIMEEHFKLVRSRLGDVICAFTVLDTLQRRSDQKINPRLSRKIRRNNLFWGEILYAQLQVVILSIGAIVDRTGGSASLRTLVVRAKRLGPHPGIGRVETCVTAIDKKYTEFRNKLVGHIDPYWNQAVEDFNALGLRLGELERDINKLEYALKVMQAIINNEPAPSEDDAADLQFDYHPTVELTQRSAQAFFDSIDQYFPDI